MGMFIVKAETPCLVIKSEKEWYPENIKSHTTTRYNCFDKSELIIDPTGIAKWANGPGNVTVGSAYAKSGYFGFRRDGWILLVHHENVIYG